MIEIGIIGGTGYTGVELLRLPAVHPEAKLQVIASRGVFERALPSMNSANMISYHVFNG